jgi:hypothetical protein
MKQNPRNPTTATESITQTSSQATKSIICENLHIRNPQNRKNDPVTKTKLNPAETPKDANRNTTQKQEKHRKQKGRRNKKPPTPKSFATQQRPK